MPPQLDLNSCDVHKHLNRANDAHQNPNRHPTASAEPVQPNCPLDPENRSTAPLVPSPPLVRLEFQLPLTASSTPRAPPVLPRTQRAPPPNCREMEPPDPEANSCQDQ